MPNLIICEDESLIALDTQRQLLKFGYAVLGIYASAEEAVERCDARDVDLVLMDIRLKGAMDGIDGARLIHERYGIPVILITAFADSEIIARAKDSHLSGYVLKPFDERDLQTSIEMALYRHSMDLRLRHSEQRYRGLFEQAPSANCIVTPEGRISDCNATFIQLLGFSDFQHAISQDIHPLFKKAEDAESFLRRCRERESVRTDEWQLRSLDGKNLTVIATIALVHAASGELEEIRAYLIDFTERRELESQLRQAQKMEAMGRLAGGIAHDFNNIITAIMGYCNLLADDLKGKTDQLEELQGIQNAAQKAVNLTRQLLAFSRKRSIEPRALDVNLAMKELEKMARRLVRENITLRFFTEARQSTVSIDPGQFEQVLINLIVNAKDAMGESGSLVVDTANAESDGSAAFHNVAPGTWVVISVRDTGKGIDPDSLQHIFEPFFTTKGLEHGTGLGLSTVYAIVTQNGGQVHVESTVGKGTTFFIYLPLLERVEATEPDNGPELVAEAKRRGSILLVEDDDYLRSLLARVLTKAGYLVHEAANPGDAILIAEHEKDFVLLTDVVMPRMSGHELAERLSVARKDLRVLFMSGYSDKRTEKLRKRSDLSAFIQKPFSHDQLMIALDELLSR